MSQELTITEVRTVEAQNFQREFAPVLSKILNAAPIEVSAGVRKCCGKCHAKATNLQAPSELKVIQTDYDRHLAVAQKRHYGKVEQLKVAAIATLVQSQENLLISEPSVVAEQIQRIVDAKTFREVSQEVKSTFKEVKAQHTKAFVANLTKAVTASAISVGFKHVLVQEPRAGMTRIVGTNQIGQNIIAEIETAKHVDIHTELVGFMDGSCEKVMRKFDEELSARGITTKHKEQKPTYGIPRLPYAQRLAKPRPMRRRVFEDEAMVAQEKTVERITLKN